MKLLSDGQGRRFPAARLALCVILVAAAIGGLPTLSRACGTATHHEIIDRALVLLDKQAYPRLATLLETYHGAVEAGAVFPDWCYVTLGGCGSEPEHWAPYRTAYASYLSTFFQAPRDEVDLIAITFFFGLIGHQEADYPWHFGPNPFESTGASQDHTFGFSIESAADVFVNVDYGEKDDADVWIVPLDAILYVYGTMDYNVNKDSLISGMNTLKTVHDASKVTSQASYWWDKLRHPWTYNNLVSYPYGGLNDGANKTAAAWQAAWHELSYPYRLFLPLMIHRDPVSTPDIGLQDGAKPTASVAQQTWDEASDSGSHNARLMAWAQALVKEGAVKEHWRLENGILYIEPIEVLDYQRLDQLTRQMLGGRAGPSSR